MHKSITSEIFQVGGSEYTSVEDAAIYLICFNGRSALVDAGCGYRNQALYRNISECGVDLKSIEYLMITHCHFDHTGGGAAVRKEIGCKTVAHKLEALYLEQGDNIVTAAEWYDAEIEPFPVDVRLSQDKTDLQLGGRAITAIHAPGHSPGSVIFLTESDNKKILFGQDVHGPLSPALKSNRADYIDSLNMMITLHADILCEGHFGIYTGRQNIEKFIRSFL